MDYAEAPRVCNGIKKNCKPRAEGKRNLDYAEAPRVCNEVKKIKIRKEPGAIPDSFFIFHTGASSRGKTVYSLSSITTTRLSFAPLKRCSDDPTA